MNEETATEKLSAALRGEATGPEDGPGWSHVAAAALLPVVREIAAEELREAADAIEDVGEGALARAMRRINSAGLLHDRADALTEPTS